MGYNVLEKMEQSTMGRVQTTSTKRTTRDMPGKPNQQLTSYINVNRAKKDYKDKYKREVENAKKEYRKKLGKPEDYEFTQQEWRNFFKTILIPLDAESERMMIDLFKKDRAELNQLLILHNTRASDNLAEVYFKKYLKESPNKWHDLEDFKQMAMEGQRRREDEDLFGRVVQQDSQWRLA